MTVQGHMWLSLELVCLFLPSFAFLFNNVRRHLYSCFACEWIESGFPALSSLFCTLYTRKGASTPTLVQIMYLSSCMDSDSADVADLGTLVKVKDWKAPCSTWKERWSLLEKVPVALAEQV